MRFDNPVQAKTLGDYYFKDYPLLHKSVFSAIALGAAALTLQECLLEVKDKHQPDGIKSYAQAAQLHRRCRYSAILIAVQCLMDSDPAAYLKFLSSLEEKDSNHLSELSILSILSI